MKKYIDRDALVEYAHSHYGMVTASDILDFPTVDAELVKHGRWVSRGDYAICTVCGGSSGTQYDGVEPIPRLTPYCPNCFAKMDGEGNENETH